MPNYNYDSLVRLGISFEDAVSLRRISMTLHRWHELECGNSDTYASYILVRGKKTGKVFEYDDNGTPFMETNPHDGKPRYWRVPDRERGAHKRLASIMAKYPTLTAYVQTDPRGCALYIGEGLTDTNYNRGVAIYK